MAHFRNCLLQERFWRGKQYFDGCGVFFKFINHKTQTSKTVCSTTHTILAGPLFPQSCSSSEDHT